MEKLVKDILSKKELQNLDESIVKEFIEQIFKQNPSLKKKLEKKEYNARSSEYKKVLKESRKILREIYGVFFEESKNTRLEILKNKEDSTTRLLDTHTSTKERLPFYHEVYEKIFSITGKPTSIMDLACGLNPVSYEFLECTPTYFASDISEKDMIFLKEFFKQNKIKGSSKKIDLVTEQEKLERINADICFLFKALDSLELRERQISKKLIESLNCNWIVISFSKISLGGNKPITRTKRQWIFNFLEKNSYKFEEFETQNELFIVVKNKKSKKLLSVKRKK